MKILGCAVVLVALTLAVPAAFGDDGQVPFAATSSLVSTTGLQPREPCGPAASGYFGETNVYVGTGTRLGRFELTENLCLNVNARPLIPFTAFGTYVAANGDQLTYLASGTLNQATGATSGGVFRFLWGMGRFANAEGAGSTALVMDEAGEITGSKQTGGITYNASDRSA